MGRAKCLLILAAALLTASGCAKLQVRVDVADANEVRAAVALERARSDAVDIAARSDAELRAEAVAMKAEVDELFNTFANAISELGDGLPAGPRAALSASAQRYRAGSEEEAALHQAIDDWYQEAVRLHMEIRRTYAVSQPEERWYATGRLAELIRRRRELDRTSLSDIEASIGQVRRAIVDTVNLAPAAVPAQPSADRALAGARTAAPVEAAAEGAPDQEAQSALETRVTAAAVRAQRAIERSIIADGSLVGSGFAYPLASLDEAFWEERYNEARGLGYFGNTNIVIRMNHLGDFSVKGLSFDASTVAAVAGKAATQAVLLGAQIAGAPVTTQAQSGQGSGEAADTNALVTASQRVQAAQLSLAGADASEDARRMALIELGFAVLNEENAIKGGDHESAAAAIDDVFSTLEPILRRSPPTPSAEVQPGED
ncbi:MAG: hypothetical protein ACFE0P_15420 [Oceanicaulis sp.]